MRTETVESLRDLIGSAILRAQERHASLWRESEHERHTGGPLALVIQGRLATEFAAIKHMLNCYSDEQYLVRWCRRINSKMTKDWRKAKKLEYKARERADYVAIDMSTHFTMIMGLFERNVQ